jgi:hypothetical protein
MRIFLHHNATKLFVLMFLNYALNAFSFRMLAKANYLGVGAADAAIAYYGFTMLKGVQGANTRVEQAAYTFGGMFGSLFGVWLTV